MESRRYAVTPKFKCFFTNSLMLGVYLDILGLVDVEHRDKY